jgi:hypothetical protein
MASQQYPSRGNEDRRIERGGTPGVRRKPVGGPKELTYRQILLARYMIFGSPHPGVRRVLSNEPHPDANLARDGYHLALEPNQPLSLLDAADALGIRRRSARQLSTYPIFQKQLAEEQARKIDIERKRALARGEPFEERGEKARTMTAGIVIITREDKART